MKLPAGQIHNVYMCTAFGEDRRKMAQSPSFVALNLGCGNHTSPSAVNIDFSRALRLTKIPLLGRFIRRSYPDKFSELDQVKIFDLRRGIPFQSESVDIVYHSHFLEHLSYEDAPGFLAEVKRVLKPDGIHRIVVPNFATHVNQVARDIDNFESTGQFADNNLHIWELLEQSVRVEPAGLRSYSRYLRPLIKLTLGSAQKRGEVHRMMYTLGSLTEVLIQNGFDEINQVSPEVSSFHGWPLLNLDLGQDFLPIHQNSLYVECKRLVSSKEPLQQLNSI